MLVEFKTKVGANIFINPDLVELVFEDVGDRLSSLTGIQLKSGNKILVKELINEVVTKLNRGLNEIRAARQRNLQTIEKTNQHETSQGNDPIPF